MTGPDQESSPDNPSSAWLAHYEEASKRRRARGSRRSRTLVEEESSPGPDGDHHDGRDCAGGGRNVVRHDVQMIRPGPSAPGPSGSAICSRREPVDICASHAHLLEPTA